MILTEEEIINLLKRSFVPTVVVEGKYDQMVYRWIEDSIGTTAISVLPCGGRDTLLNVFQRRAEFANSPVAFLADRDMWLFTGIPARFQDVIWTEGYSIENDIYASAPLEKLLTQTEISDFHQLLVQVFEWFAFEVEEYRAGREACVAIHINQIIPLGATVISNRFKSGRGFRNPKRASVKEVTRKYGLRVRGKTLFDVLVRFLSAPKRVPKHSRDSLLEMGVKLPNNSRYLDRILVDIKRELGM
jgi:hypothetical protein